MLDVTKILSNCVTRNPSYYVFRCICIYFDIPKTYCDFIFDETSQREKIVRPTINTLTFVWKQEERRKDEQIANTKTTMVC